MKQRFELPQGFWRIVTRGFMGLFRFEVRGLEHLQRYETGAVILAGNHTGMMDTPMVMSAVTRRFRFLMSEKVFGWGIIGKLVPYANIIALHEGREKSALLRVIHDLRAGGGVCIFPEGRLTRDGELQDFHQGVAFIQEKSGAPIIPFAIHGGYDTWREGQRFPNYGRKVILQFGPAMQVPAGSVDRAALTQAVKERIAGLVAQVERTENPNAQPQSVPVQASQAEARKEVTAA